jgi:hypothetical protein
MTTFEPFSIRALGLPIPLVFGVEINSSTTALALASYSKMALDPDPFMNP